MSFPQNSASNDHSEDEMNGNNDDDDDDEISHVKARHTLDPKVIHNLEMEILRMMAGSNPVDPLFSSGLPDSSVNNASNSGGGSGTTVFDSTTAFTMESFTVDSVTTTVSDETFDQALQMPKKSNQFCPCGRKQSGNMRTNGTFQESGKPLAVGDNKSTELLPPPSPDSRGKICLVLDLDETLVHSSFLAIPHADFRFILGIDQNPVGVFVCIRPGTERFLRELGPLYEIVIFTASSQLYADAVINFIDKGKMVKHRLYRESCTDFGGNFIKDLSRLNRSLEKVVIVDNSPVAYLLQPYNAISIPSWFDDPTDNQLFILLDFLKENHRVKNVYDILVASENSE